MRRVLMGIVECLLHAHWIWQVSTSHSFFGEVFRNSSISAVPLITENIIIPCMSKSKDADIQNFYSKLNQNSIHFFPQVNVAMDVSKYSETVW